MLRCRSLLPSCWSRRLRSGGAGKSRKLNARLGDPDIEEGRAFLTERSPLTHIDRVVRPILIAQGINDVRVVPAESEQMVTALKARGVPVHLHRVRG
jgi:dipeptidyl aminopeptidase/acylaminoacyl peptidase